MAKREYDFTLDQIRNASCFVSRRSNGCYLGRIAYYTDSEETGRSSRKEISRAFPKSEVSTKAKATRAVQAWHRELIEEAKALEAKQFEEEHPSWTVADYADMAIRDYSQASESSKNGYRPYLKRIREEFSNTLLEELTADDVNRWQRRLKREGMANTSVAHAHALLSQVLNYALEDGLVRLNVCKLRAAKAPARDKVEHNVLTSQERGRLMDYLNSAPPSPLGIAVRIALETGMRQGEVCALTWGNTDLEQGIVKVRQSVGKMQGGRYLKEPKSGAGIRDIPISEALRAVLRAWKLSRWQERQALAQTTAEEFSELYVVGYVDGRWYNPDVLGKEWRALAGFLQLKGTQGKPTFHDLRHTAITVWIRELDLDPYTASKMAGHATPSHTLNLYGNTDDEAKRRAADGAGALLERERREARHRRELEEAKRGHVIDLATGTEV